MKVNPLKILFQYGSWTNNTSIEVEYNIELNAYNGTVKDVKVEQYNVKIEAEEITNLIEKYDVKNWKPSYFSELNVLDGHQWRLKISYENEEFISEGSNEFPHFFHSFETEIMKLALEKRLIKHNW